MGYYTDFHIRVVSDMNADVGVDKPYDVAAFMRWAENHNGGHLKELFEEIFVEDNYYNTKWYSWEEDMRAFSSAFDSVLFEVTGNGEEGEDKWKAYFLNGLMQKCQAKVTIEYPEHDPTQMK